MASMMLTYFGQSPTFGSIVANLVFVIVTESFRGSDVGPRLAGGSIDKECGVLL